MVKKTLSADIVSTGDVISAGSIDLAFETEGVVKTVYVKRGQNVKFGDVLAAVNTSILEAQAKQISADIVLERARLTQFLAGITLEEVTLTESRISAAQTAVDNARTALEDAQLKADNDMGALYTRVVEYAHTVVLNADNAFTTLAGIYDEKNQFRDFFIIAESRKKSEAQWQMIFTRTALENIKVKQASLQSDASNAHVDIVLSDFKTNLEVMRSLLSKTAELLDTVATTFGSPDSGTFKTTLAVQRSLLNETQSVLLDLEQKIAAQEINNQIALTEAKNSITQLTAFRRTLENELAVQKLTSETATLPVLQARIKERESALGVLQEKIRGAVLRSPAEGIVEDIRIGKGSLIKPHIFVMTLAPSASAQIEVSLDSRNGAFVKPGDHVIISLAGERVASTIARVRDGKAIIYFEDVFFASVSDALAEVRITATIKKDVLMVPEDFIFDEKGMKKVYVLIHKERKQRTVLTGIAWGNEREISEGVSEGELLVR